MSDRSRSVGRGMRALTPACLALAIIVFGCGSEGVAMRFAQAQTPGVPEPPEPLPTEAPTRASSGDVRRGQVWFERNFVDAYTRVGRKDPAWDAGARALVRNLAPVLLLEEPVPDAEQTRVRELLDAGCDDPLVLYLAGIARDAVEPSTRGVTELLERAVEGMHDVAYPRVVAAWAAARLREGYDRSSEGGGRRKALEPVELGWLLESLSDGSYAPGEEPLLVEHLVRGVNSPLFDRHRAQVMTALGALPELEPWARLVLEGNRLIEDAWASRGGGYVSEVTDAGWKGFRASLEEAREALVESWRLRPDRPEAAALMVSVSLADPQPGESPRLWFDRAVAHRFDYRPAYDMLLNALRRRWGGSDEELLSFARECAGTRRFDTAVPMVAFRATERISRDFLDETEQLDVPPDWPERRPYPPYDDPETYELIQTVLKRSRQDPSSSTTWQRYASLEAAIAYKARRYEDALKQLRNVGGRLVEEARRSVGEPQLEARIETMASPIGRDVLRAGELFRAGESARSAELLRGASERAPAGARPFVDHRLAIAELEVALAAGQRVSFLPAAGLAGWSTQAGEWRVESDGSLLGTSTARGLMIVCEARVGPDFEIEADVEVVSTSNGQHQSGIVFGDKMKFASPTWSSFRVKKTSWEGEVAYFSQNFYRPLSRVERPAPLKYHVVIRSLDGALSASVDGEEIISAYRPEWERALTPEDRVGFGAYLDDNVFSVRYSNVMLRRLDAPQQVAEETSP